MKTQTKLGITLCLNSVMMMLTVFAKPLHIPQSFQWVLTIGIFIAIGFMFYFIKQQKLEKQQSLAAGTPPPLPPPAGERQKIRNRLILMMVLSSLVALCGPFWMPLTGTTLGMRGDFIVGLIVAAMMCTIFGIRLRKLSTE